MPKVEDIVRRAAREYISLVLSEVFGLKVGKEIRLSVRFKGMRDAWGLTVAGRNNYYLVYLNPEICRADEHLKGICTHEALHIAYTHYQSSGDLDEFWEKIAAAVEKSLEILQTHYGTSEETCVQVLEPIISLHLFPPPRS